MRAVILLPILLASACSLVNDPSGHLVPGDGMDGGADASVPRVERDDYCPAFARTACEARGADCCDDPSFDVEACTRQLQMACGAAFGAIIADDRITWDAEAAGRAVASGSALAATCDPDVADWYISREGFYGPARGSIPGGGECTPRGMMEIDFLVANLACERKDQICQQSGERWLCVDALRDGEVCRYGLECASLRCEHAGGFMPRRCGSGEPTGSSCTWEDECASSICLGPVLGKTCRARTQANVYCGTDG